jgi:CelD/BcsL family acetyltransferase involved in cellulose biosynthesis
VHETRPLSFSYVYGTRGLDAIRGDWEDIFGRCANQSFYNDWRWHLAIQRHLVADDLCYVRVSAGDRPVAILPLQFTIKRFGVLFVRQLSFPVHPAIDLSDMPIALDYDGGLFPALLDRLRKEPPFPWDVLQLVQLAERSALRRELRQYKFALRPNGFSAYLAKGAQDDRLLAQVSKKQAKNVLRHLRNAESCHGAGNLSQLLRCDDLDGQYESFLQVEASGWKGDGGTGSAIALRLDARAFYREVLGLFCQSGQAVVNVLRLRDTPVAAQIGLRTGKSLNFLKIGYDERFKEFGPGAIALLKAIELADGNTEEVNLVTCPPWSDRWHFQHEPKYLFEYFNQTIYGQLLKSMILARRRLRLSIKQEPGKA